MADHSAVSRAGSEHERISRACGVQSTTYAVAAPQRRRVAVHIRAIHAQSRSSYGRPRILQQLRQAGVPVGKQRLARLIREHEIAAKQRKRFGVTTDSNHNLPIADNLLDRQFTVAQPDQVWVGDITYIATHEGWALSGGGDRSFQPPGSQLLATPGHVPSDRHGRTADGVVLASANER